MRHLTDPPVDHPPVDHKPTERMERLAIRVDDAIAARRIYVDPQPVVRLSNGEVFGYEALARCDIPELRSPLHLLKAAVDQGAIGRLGRELRRCAVDAARGACLFVNVHPDELDEESLCGSDDPLFQHPGEVVLEVPESAPLMRYRFAWATLTALRKRGVRVALDDFGAGYSNLSYVSTLAPDIVKIDRDLIAGVEPGTRQHRLLASLASLCAQQGALVVAEGIETRRELEAVIQTGIPLAQGYYLGRPSRTGQACWSPPS